MKLKLTRKQYDALLSNNPVLIKLIANDYKLHIGLSEPTWLLNGPVYYVSEDIFFETENYIRTLT